MKTAILYHQVKQGIDCPDGIVSAWVAAIANPDSEIIGCTYQSGIAMPSQEQIFLVDFSLPRETIKSWQQSGKQVWVIDHHQTAWEQLQNLDNLLGKIDISGDYCGATLAWGFFLKGSQPPVFLKYIQDRDNWDFKFPETQFIHEAFSKLRSLCPDIKSKFAFFDALSRLSERELKLWLVPIGKKLLEPKLEAIAKAFLRWEVFILGEYQIPLIRLNINEERLVSDICMKMYQDDYISGNYPFVACLMSDNQSVSLRSNKWGNNFDVAEIAKQFDGGGHRNAAGFKLKEPLPSNVNCIEF